MLARGPRAEARAGLPPVVGAGIPDRRAVRVDVSEDDAAVAEDATGCVLVDPVEGGRLVQRGPRAAAVVGDGIEDFAQGGARASVAGVGVLAADGEDPAIPQDAGREELAGIHHVNRRRPSSGLVIPLGVRSKPVPGLAIRMMDEDRPVRQEEHGVGTQPGRQIRKRRPFIHRATFPRSTMLWQSHGNAIVGLAPR